MRESALAPGIARDLSLALGEPLGSDGAWAVRVYLKPFVRCIWLGAVLMMLGGLCAASERRRGGVCASGWGACAPRRSAGCAGCARPSRPCRRPTRSRHEAPALPDPADPVHR